MAGRPLRTSQKRRAAYPPGISGASRGSSRPLRRGNVGKPGGFCRIVEPEPRPPKPRPWLPGTPQFAEPPREVQSGSGASTWPAASGAGWRVPSSPRLLQRRPEVYDEVFPLAARPVGLPPDDGNASPLPAYFKIPSHVELGPDEYVLTTFQWNVHTQGRTAHLMKYQAEMVHTNPLFTMEDRDIPENIRWAKSRRGPGGGVPIIVRLDPGGAFGSGPAGVFPSAPRGWRGACRIGHSPWSGRRSAGLWMRRSGPLPGKIRASWTRGSPREGAGTAG